MGTSGHNSPSRSRWPSAAAPSGEREARFSSGFLEHARLDSNQRLLPPEGSALSTELRAPERDPQSSRGSGTLSKVTRASPIRAGDLSLRVGTKLKKVVLSGAIPQAARAALYETSQRLRSYGSREEPGVAAPRASRSHEGGERGSPLISFHRSRLRHVLIAAISDTHLPRGRRRLPDACLERLRSADLILHAGDISTVEILNDIEQIGPPVKAVHGNVDCATLRAKLPEALEVRTPDGARIAMLHDAGPSKRRLERMKARFPHATAVVFGHSHIPLHEERDGFQI
ncbi:MAG: uncharacterized protein QOF69_1987, partial [Solirubrobacteraceae bacterium]|nr:uncharacterized protein [Solirubrobacteraceae bacterium]